MVPVLAVMLKGVVPCRDDAQKMKSIEKMYWPSILAAIRVLVCASRQCPYIPSKSSMPMCRSGPDPDPDPGHLKKAVLSVMPLPCC